MQSIELVLQRCGLLGFSFVVSSVSSAVSVSSPSKVRKSSSSVVFKICVEHDKVDELDEFGDFDASIVVSV